MKRVCGPISSFRREALHAPTQLGRVRLAHGEIAQRFRQHEIEQDAERETDTSRDEEHDPPAPDRDQPRGHLADDRDTGGEAEHAAHHHRDAEALRRNLYEIGDRRRHDAADAKANDEAIEAELRQRGREAAPQRRQRIAEHGQERRGAAAVAIVDVAEEICAQERAEIAEAEHPAELGLLCLKGAQDRRRAGERSAEIEAVGEDHQEGEKPDADLDLAELAAFDQLGNVDE